MLRENLGGHSVWHGGGACADPLDCFSGQGGILSRHADRHGGVHAHRKGRAVRSLAMSDSINHEGFSDMILHPGEAYDTTTVYEFIAK